ncbi:MAG: sigma-70 family RNA polymerase sigma factor [Nocardioidaceae bacterium]
MPSDAVTAFLNQVGSIPLLTAAQEVRCAIDMEAGALAAERLSAGRSPWPPDLREDLELLVLLGDQARELMVQANLRLVVSMARRYTRTGAPLLDLVQEGTVGLIHAVDRFDYRRGCKFSTYAVWWIRQALTRGIADSTRTVRVPVQVLTRLNGCLGRRRELAERWGREPTVVEVADACGMGVAETTALLAASAEPLSLDTDGTDTAAVLEAVADRHAVDLADQAADRLAGRRLREALDDLEPAEREVLRRRFGIGVRPQGPTAIAAELGMTRERVRHLERRALLRLRGQPAVSALREAERKRVLFSDEDLRTAGEAPRSAIRPGA